MVTMMDKLKQKCRESGQHVYADRIGPDYIKLIAFPRNSMVNVMSYDIRKKEDLDLAISVLTQDQYQLTKKEIVNAILQINI